MTKKNERRVIGRNIRRATGLPLPIAMGIAKSYVNHEKWDVALNFGSFVLERSYGCDCCGPETIGVRGPKGELLFSEFSNAMPRREGKTVESPIKFITVKVQDLDKSLAALRQIGSAMIIEARPFIVDGVALVGVAVNFSKRKAYKALRESHVSDFIHGKIEGTLLELD